jgi:hypothetical protein
MSFAVTVAPPAPALTTNTPWKAVVEAYLDVGIDRVHTRRAYERHLREAFAVFGDNRQRPERDGPGPLPRRRGVLGACARGPGAGTGGPEILTG